LEQNEKKLETEFTGASWRNAVTIRQNGVYTTGCSGKREKYAQSLRTTILHTKLYRTEHRSQDFPLLAFLPMTLILVFTTILVVPT